MSAETKISNLLPNKKIRNNNSRQKIRVLSIDGGGIRGIISATLLSHLEKIIQEKSGNKEARLADYFDFIAGTSTGGILATVYLMPDPKCSDRPKYSAQDALDLYLNKGHQIFRSSLFNLIRSYFGLLRYKFKSQGINQALKETFGEESLLHQLVKPCLITAYDVSREKSYFFTRCSARRNARKNFKIWEVARATSAAPSFFKPARLKSEYGECHTMIDGGVIANNPSLCAFTEVIKSDFSHLHGWSHGDRPTADDIIFLSIGTGLKQRPTDCSRLERKGLLGWLKTITKVRMMGSSDTVQHQIEQIFKCSVKAAGQLFRLDPGIFDADHKMDNASPSNIALLHMAGIRNVERYHNLLEDIANKLLNESNLESVTSKDDLAIAS